MKTLQRKSQIHVFLLVIMLDMLVWIQTPTAQLTLSSPTDVQCYGRPVTLVCTHPMLPQIPEYLQTEVNWGRDGLPISALSLGRSTASPTRTRLQFNITENTTGNYTCFLVNAVRGGTNESNVVPVIPLDLTPPKVTNIDPFESFITVEWTPQPCDVRYRVSWMYTNDDGTTTTDSGVSDQVANYTIPTSVQGMYTVLVQAVDGVGNVGPATSEVVRSTYPRPNTDAPPCEDRSLVLTCLVSGLHNDTRSFFMWIDRNSNLTNSTVYIITGPQLMIANVSALSVEEDKAIRCCEVLNNGIVVEGVEYKVEPLAQPGPPEVTITTTDFTITLTWNTVLSCFESEMFTFVVIWNEIGSGTSTNVTTSSSPYTISGLQPGTSYQISVQGVGGSGVVGDRRVLNLTTSATPPTEGDNSIIIVVPIAVVGLVLTAAVVVIVIACVVWRYMRSRISPEKPGELESVSAAVLERMFTEQGSIQATRDQPQTASQRATTNYADLDFTGDRPAPAPPPSLEKVTYTKVENEPSEPVDAYPELSPKQDQQQIKAFRDDVKAVLDKNGIICKDLEDAEEVEGIKRESAFTAEYNGINVVASCVYTSSDLNINHVHMVIEAMHLIWAKVGLLISNQPTIPSECLLTLEDAGCQFVPVSGYGEEGWEDRMIDKVKDVFSELANDDSESEDLQISVQETSPPPDDNGELPIIHAKENIVGMPPAEPFRSQPHGDSDCTQNETEVGSFTSTSEYHLEDDERVPLIQ